MMKTIGAKRIKLKIGQDWESPYLHILLTREDNLVVARCLDFTVSSHGQNEDQAIESLAEAIREYIRTAIEDDSINQIYDPANGKYWRMFNEEVSKVTGKQLIRSLQKSRKDLKSENFCDFGITISYA